MRPPVPETTYGNRQSVAQSKGAGQSSGLRFFWGIPLSSIWLESLLQGRPLFRGQASSCTCVGLMHPFQKTGHGARTDCDMPPNLNIAVPEFTGNDRHLLAGLGVLGDQQLRRQQLAKPSVEVDDRVRCG